MAAVPPAQINAKLKTELSSFSLTNVPASIYRKVKDIPDEDKDPIGLFKEFFEERKPIKCSKLLLAIYDKHKSGFRKAVLLSECFYDPLGLKYNQEIHEFTLSIINRAYKLANFEQYPKEFMVELQQLYLAFIFFNHNNIKNTEK